MPRLARVRVAAPVGSPDFLARMAVKTQHHVDPFDSAVTRRDAWRLGMWIFIVVVAMVFGAAIVGYLAVRLDEHVGDSWRPPGAPGIPRLFMLSTLLVGAASAAHIGAQRAARRGAAAECTRWLGGALAACIAFLGVQAAAWTQLIRENLRVEESLYAFTFFVLTALHAVHVLGGLPSLALTTKHAHDGRYGPDDATGLDLSAMYWHTLAIVWVALYATLWYWS